ncbi:MAG: hypothetical protein JSS53_01345 [Proteobacteria bacterium]|nr:hypothetical protein [Pseudomonadota bacterium]
MSKIKSFFRGFARSFTEFLYDDAKMNDPLIYFLGVLGGWLLLTVSLVLFAFPFVVVGLIVLIGSLGSGVFLGSIPLIVMLTVCLLGPAIPTLLMAGFVTVAIINGIKGGIKEVKLEQEKEKSESDQLVTTLSSTHEVYQSSDVIHLQQNRGNTASIMKAMGATSDTKLLLSTEVEESTQSYHSWLFSRVTGFLCSFRSHPEPVVHEHSVNYTA